MKTLESFCQPQYPTRPNEDETFTTPHIACVIDGVSGLVGQAPVESLTLGQLAAKLVHQAAEAIGPQTTARQFVDHATELLAAARKKHQLPPSARLAAGVTLYHAKREQVWRVADGHFAFYGPRGKLIKQFVGGKEFDDILVRARAVYVDEQLAGFERRKIKPSLSDLGVLNQKARMSIEPLLVDQVLLANMAKRQFGFGVLDGTPVPDKFIDITALPKATQKVVLTTDGCPRPLSSIKLTLQALTKIRKTDPLLLGTNSFGLANAKGFLKPDGQLNTYYDDISYLSLEP